MLFIVQDIERLVRIKIITMEWDDEILDETAEAAVKGKLKVGC